MISGISIIICCYNSATRLPKTLANLVAQKVTNEIPWEVIIVDNASTDNTHQVATESWKQDAPASLRVVYEPQPGLSYARQRGFTEAKYDIISFVDDDNWVCPEWVQTVAHVMSEHPEVGACGGLNKAVSEVNLPWWFQRYEQYYAVGTQAEHPGDITQHPGILWGAGLSVRKQAWQKLQNQSFHSILTGRKGTSLSSCEDYELCFALRAAGWHLWYEPRLYLQHCLPSSRLQWSYMRRLMRGNGASSVGLDAYSVISEVNNRGWDGWRSQIMKNWYIRVAITLVKLCCYPHKLILFSCFSWEGDSEILHIETLLGRLSELIQKRQVYTLNLKIVREAPWRIKSQSGLTSNG
jgi:glycosyltransferase involved in cell wall biosynthesis